MFQDPLGFFLRRDALKTEKRPLAVHRDGINLPLPLLVRQP
jgi:hypothetical protein